MNNNFQHIPITAITADPNQPRKYFNEIALKELTNSVKDKGVLQPIMVRKVGDKYMVVCGERRFKAATGAGIKDMPCIVRELTDQETVEIQIIENLQRQDPHPMDEAVTYKSMVENKTKPYSIADIAAKINKPESYVTQRLSLNNLIPELQKEFWDGKFLIGHAMLFARLTPADQKDCFKNCKEWGSKEYKSIRNVQDHIERNIMRVLSSAPFKRDDADLLAKAGACTSCTKRSGCNTLLFADIKQDDRCFDGSCFTQKLEAHLLKVVEATILEKPQIRLLQSTSGYNTEKVSPAIVKLAKDHKVTMLEDNWQTIGSYKDGKNDIEVTVLWVNGHNMGKFEKKWLRVKGSAINKAKANAKGGEVKITPSMIDDEIAGIKQRQKRAQELDAQKIWEQVKPIARELKNFKFPFDGPATQEERNAIGVALLNKISHNFKDEAQKALGLKGRWLNIDEVKKLNAVTDQQIIYLLRLFFIDTLNEGLSHETNESAYALMQVLRTTKYAKVQIDKIEADQKAVADKRIERANKRVEDLQNKKKALAKVKPVVAEVKKPAKKSAPKKAPKKVVVKKAVAKKSPVKKAVKKK